MERVYVCVYVCIVILYDGMKAQKKDPLEFYYSHTNTITVFEMLLFHYYLCLVSTSLVGLYSMLDVLDVHGVTVDGED